MDDGAGTSIELSYYGRKPILPSLDPYPWATLVGYDTCVTVIGSDGYLAEAAPETGDVIRVELCFPFVGRTGVPFWTCFHPAPAYENGYDTYPGELIGFCLVRLRIDTFLSTETVAQKSLADATVLEVVDPAGLMAFSPSTGNVSRVLDSLVYKPSIARCGQLRHVSSNIEGDVYIWALLFVGDGGTALLAFQVECFGDEEMVAGHRPLSPAEAAFLLPDEPGPEAVEPSCPDERGVP